MSQRISLAGHIANAKSTLIFKICKKFFETTNIKYFCYLRRYKNGNFTFLPSMIDFGSYLFEDGNYPYTWFAGVPFSALKSGYILWDIAKQVSCEQTNEISTALTTLFQLPVGIDVIEKHENYCDFYCFSSNTPNIYFLSVQDLYQFIFYFKQECRHLLLDAAQNTLQLHSEGVNVNPIPIMSDLLAEPKNDIDYDIKRYYLNGRYEGVFLTKREVEVVKKIVEGEAVKCLADSLFISPRTLEHHITNIKNKLNVSRTAEMLQIARINKIIT